MALRSQFKRALGLEDPRTDITCLAPENSLRFSPDGEVHACCANHEYVLGHVGEQSVDEVWNGPRMTALREALARGDYSLGCQDCGDEYRLGNRLTTHAQEYDRWSRRRDGPKLRRVEFALSNTCNLQCVMCNGDLSSAIRAQREHRAPLPARYGDAFFEEARSLLPAIDVAVFIGGEPFLTREAFRMWDLMIEEGFTGEVHVTTNGTVWNDKVEHYFRSLRMSVAMSIDGTTAETFEAVRPGASFEKVMRNRERFLAATRSMGTSFTLNHCVMTENWHEFGPFLADAAANDLAVHAIPVLYPPRYSLFHLPVEELQAVVDTLTAEEPAWAVTLGPRMAQWDSTLAHLRGHLARLRAGTATVGTAVAAPTRRAPESDPIAKRLTARVDELRSWSGSDPVRCHIEDGAVRSVDEPSWASHLDVSSWFGQHPDRLLDLVAARLGPPGEHTLERLGDGLTASRITFGDGADAVRFRSCTATFGTEDPPRQVMYIASPDGDRIAARSRPTG